MKEKKDKSNEQERLESERDFCNRTAMAILWELNLRWL
jgi:hypothetical protein